MAFRTNKTPVLQEKTASGSVASFNTILQKPLVNGEFTIQAYQEGTGGPSPDNVRNIVGFSAVNMYKRGINLWDEEHEGGTINTSTGANQGTDVYGERSKNFIAIKSNTSIYVRSPNAVNIFIIEYDKNKNFIRYNGYKKNEVYNVSADAYYIRFYTNNTTYRLDGVSINYPSTDTDYHAYTGNTYTIQLGQEVYGAEVDAVNGVAHCTHKLADMGDINWTYLDSSGTQFFYGRSMTVKASSTGGVVPNMLADIYKTVGVNTLRSNTDYMVSCGYSSYYAGFLLVKNPDYTDADLFKQAMANHKICYELNTPFDIQLTPTQIETLIGNNTIFADTGDVDLTYNDLDLAKRGSFREVFKLPS